ncbi:MULTISPECIES: ribosome hibernation-promoting factor, HPF/YfiA family [Caproicibacter]|uniref:Ribosome hibernation promoting factor n=1 Tax=Caproicibacter fermentans TaxID=2576756 RepID=A0A7G8TBE8_9FIRM|nr:ribosome-associated translation inhibitor RaiA [Caproicibacter fermentans]QNK40939.1 ribosome-associated translation inhibitor RaiA [Caproicibacter fermentans]
MKITITGRKVNLRDHFKELAVKKLSRFDRIFDEDAEAKVVVTVLKNRQTVEITVHSKGMIYRAEATAEEMNDALDDVIGALSSQIRRNKTRLEKRIHFSALDEDFQVPDDREESEEYKIVRTKHFGVKPMSVEEAILQMNLLEHQFFMFRNQEDNQINVVYKRRDGNYGLLTPDAE